MTSAYILILAVLFLGGLLAIVGDRIGTKVGKARLRLFNLRPKKTAAVVAVLTGTLISASTLGILFALSETLRDGVFRLDTIRKELRTAENDLGAISAEKEQVDTELSQVTQEKFNVERDFKQIRSRYVSMTQQAGRLRQEVQALRLQRANLLKQIPALQQQVRDRDSRLASKDNLLRQKDGQIASKDNLLRQQAATGERRIRELDQTIAQKDQVLNAREQERLELANQLNLLQRELEVLEQNAQDFATGNIALVRGEVLSFGAFIASNSEAAKNAIDFLLQTANQQAILATRPFQSNNPNEQVVVITEAQVEQLLTQIRGGREYVVRIRSAGNHVENSAEIVPVFADVAENQQIFMSGDAIAAVSLDAGQLSQDELLKLLDTLQAAAQFRARQAGILGPIDIGAGTAQTYVPFLAKLGNLDTDFDQIQAIALDDTKTVGPLRLQLVVSYRGVVVLRS